VARMTAAAVDPHAFLERRATVAATTLAAAAPHAKENTSSSRLATIKDLTTANAIELLVLARRVQNAALAATTLDFVWAHLDATTCADFLVKATRNGFPEVRAPCVQYAAEHIAAVTASFADRSADIGTDVVAEVFAAASRLPHTAATEAAKLRLVEHYAAARGADAAAALWQHISFDELDDVTAAAAQKDERVPAEIRTSIAQSGDRRTLRRLSERLEALSQALETVTREHRMAESAILAKLDSLVRRIEAVEQRVGPFTATFAGSQSGYQDGPGHTALFSNPMGIALLSKSATLIVADCSNHRIRCITPDGTVTTIAGVGALGCVDGPASQAQFYSPYDVATDSSGNIYVADYNNHRIRKISAAGVVSTVAGCGDRGAFADGKVAVAQFHHPTGVAADDGGNIYVADFRNHRIRRISRKGVVKTIAGTGVAGFSDGPGDTAMFNGPWKLALDRTTGTIVVADMNNHRIRRITSSGVVSTIAGNGSAASVDGTGVAASLNSPADVDVDMWGNIFVAEYGGHRVRKISPRGDVTTIAGSGTAPGFQDGPSALFSFPCGVVSDSCGSVYVADYGSHRIRRICPIG